MNCKDAGNFFGSSRQLHLIICAVFFICFIAVPEDIALAAAKSAGIAFPADGVLASTSEAKKKTDKILAIESVTPDYGKIGARVIIKGQNFSSNRERNIVEFNGVKATVISAKNNKALIVKVPPGAYSGYITVTVKDQTATSNVKFTVLGSTGSEIPEGMVEVPGGCFTMGDDNGDWDEKPAHNHCVSTFYIDKYETTNAQYKKECEENGREICNYLPPASWLAYYKIHDRYNDPNYSNHPVTNMASLHAEQYCKYRGKRLPTEAEWEYAARGPNSYKYPWGNEEPDSTFANFCSTCVVVGKTAEECSQSNAPGGCVIITDDPASNPNDYTGLTIKPGSHEKDKSWAGVYDMGGNVSEITSDWLKKEDLDAKKNSAYMNAGHEGHTNYTEPDLKVDQVILKGGNSWAPTYYIRPAIHSLLPDGSSRAATGFRCAY
ncbi:MAG: formylglycine-generating enzyme family protein [Nitrospinae bacterium]|nr:formylglycine-generating enzyme family protein [Nitrospinota bacterium]